VSRATENIVNKQAKNSGLAKRLKINMVWSSQKIEQIEISSDRSRAQFAHHYWRGSIGIQVGGGLRDGKSGKGHKAEQEQQKTDERTTCLNAIFEPR
jgi:hypothetical protein